MSAPGSTVSDAGPKPSAPVEAKPEKAQVKKPDESGAKVEKCKAKSE
jgi:hypothetical protein